MSRVQLAAQGLKLNQTELALHSALTELRSLGTREIAALKAQNGRTLVAPVRTRATARPSQKVSMLERQDDRALLLGVPALEHSESIMERDTLELELAALGSL
eukprot:CAMPEP_0171067600 /NCGR_PEP_ID=MMETSP0766_2-20121228/8092_1 /TAXON_ID=439317 /ORGANISM="Gambierdiscus australes, Strain CAWD 149" /LENGTH=102 /DNA_ID=CAMNT_0011523851 /DNA_START=12 /DNA_END=320 /DNA_ORIENTATION=-